MARNLTKPPSVLCLGSDETRVPDAILLSCSAVARSSWPCFPTASSYQWKRKLAASLNQISFLRVQTSEPIKDSIEIKLPSGISILVPVSAVDSIRAIVRQLAYLHSEPIGMRKSLDRLFGGIKYDLCRNMRMVACLCP